MKRGTKILIISIVAIIIIAIVSVLIKEKDSGNNIIENIINKIQDNSEDKNPDNTNTETTSSSSSTSSSTSTSSGGSGGGGGGGSSSSGSSPSCEIFEQITYSIEDINRTSVCNEYSLGNCVDKTTTCSANIKNRDSSTSGLFEIEIVFVESGKPQEDFFDSKTSSFTLSPGQLIEYTDFANIQSTGEDGLANKNINCFYNSISIPQKEAC